MAGEHSREFSARVFNGQSRLIEFGFRQGGPAGYGWSFCALQRCIARTVFQIAATSPNSTMARGTGNHLGDLGCQHILLRLAAEGGCK